MRGAFGAVQGFRDSRGAHRQQPDYVLLLGGDTHRERLAAEIVGGCLVEPTVKFFSHSKWSERWKKLPVWVSSGHGDVGDVMASCGVKAPRLTVDHSATDTVTNFTTTAAFFQKNKVRHVAVFTSDYHARRSHAVASVVLGGSGIAHTLVELPSPQSPATDRLRRQETSLRCARDVVRAFLWLLCGLHGGELGRLVHPERFPD